jgi:hypothetical protein
MLTPAKAAAKTKAKAAESPTPPAAPAKKTVKRVAKKA